MLEARRITRESSFSDIGYFWYGRISIYIINSIIGFAYLGYPIIFFVIFGDVTGGLIRKINKSGIDFWETRWFTHPILALCIIYFCLKKDISSLRYTGLFWLVFIATFLFLYFINYVSHDPASKPKTPLDESHSTLKFWAGIPTLLTSYCIHTSFYVAFNSLKFKTYANGLKAAAIALTIMFLTYQTSSLLSFGMYGSAIKSNMLVGLIPLDEPLSVILLFIYWCIAIMHLPIVFYIGKECFLIMFDDITRQSYSKNKKRAEPDFHSPNVPEEDHKEPDRISNPSDKNKNYKSLELHHDTHHEIHQDDIHHADIDIHHETHHEGSHIEHSNDSGNHNVVSNIRSNNSDETKGDASKDILRSNPKEYLNMHDGFYYGITLFLYFAVVIVSINVTDVSIVFGIVGAVATPYIVIGGPGSFYVIATHKRSVKFDGWFSIFTYVMAWIYTIFGLFLTIALTIVYTIY